jgi:hypothetical protein
MLRICNKDEQDNGLLQRRVLQPGYGNIIPGDRRREQKRMIRPAKNRQR